MQSEGLLIGSDINGNDIYYIEEEFPQLIINYGNSEYKLSKEDSENILKIIYQTLQEGLKINP